MVNRMRRTAVRGLFAALCALLVMLPGAAIAQEDIPRRGVERFRMSAYPDRFPLAPGPAEITVEGRTRNLVVSVDLVGEWPGNPTLRIHHDESMVDGMRDKADRIVAGPTEVDAATGHGSLSVMLTTDRVGSYYRAYAVLEQGGMTWRTDNYTVEWKDAKPATDLTEFLLQTPGGGDFVAVFLPLLLAGGALWVSRNAILGIVAFYGGFGVAYIFVDVNPLIAIVIGASALGLLALAITFKVTQRG